MKINNTSMQKSIIYNLIDGTVFQYDSSYYIKTTEYNLTNKLCACVNIETGELEWLTDNIMVIYYDAEVTIK